MNTPGTDAGNWAWRAPAGAFDDALATRLHDLVAAADRAL
jgi:4-alpha-glucanotransferase